MPAPLATHVCTSYHVLPKHAKLLLTVGAGCKSSICTRTHYSGSHAVLLGVHCAKTQLQAWSISSDRALFFNIAPSLQRLTTSTYLCHRSIAHMHPTWLQFAPGFSTCWAARVRWQSYVAMNWEWSIAWRLAGWLAETLKKCQRVSLVGIAVQSPDGTESPPCPLHTVTQQAQTSQCLPTSTSGGILSGSNWIL